MSKSWLQLLPSKVSKLNQATSGLIITGNIFGAALLVLPGVVSQLGIIPYLFLLFFYLSTLYYCTILANLVFGKVFNSSVKGQDIPLDTKPEQCSLDDSTQSGRDINNDKTISDKEPLLNSKTSKEDGKSQFSKKVSSELDEHRLQQMEIHPQEKGNNQIQSTSSSKDNNITQKSPEEMTSKQHRHSTIEDEALRKPLLYCSKEAFGEKSWLNTVILILKLASNLSVLIGQALMMAIMFNIYFPWIRDVENEQNTTRIWIFISFVIFLPFQMVGYYKNMNWVAILSNVSSALALIMILICCFIAQANNLPRPDMKMKVEIEANIPWAGFDTVFIFLSTSGTRFFI